MNVHQYERYWLIAALVLIVAIIATVTYGAVGIGIAMIDDSEETVDPDALGEHERFSETGTHQVGENEYEVNVIAWQFSYEPGGSPDPPIEVPAGSEVTFYVTSEDVIHSFSVVGTNVNTMVIPGEVATMTVEFDEATEYGLLCNEYCGELHHDMEGEIIVHPEEEFDLFEIPAVDAPEQVDAGEEAEITVTLANERHQERSTTLAFEFDGDEQREDVTVDGESTEEVTFTVDTTDLEDDDYSWSVTVEDGMERTVDESGQLTVGEPEED